MNRIESVLEGVYENPELRQTIVPLFIGDPGLGKTVMIQKFADDKGANLVELITSQMSPFEISGIAMPDKDTKKMSYYNFDKLENLEDGDILFFDELLNGNPVVLNACLTILEQRRFISGKPLPNIMIVAAANPQGMVPITPQIKERFIWYKVKFNATMWQEFMHKKYSMIKKVSKKLCELIDKEEFKGDNFMSPRSLDKATNMIINEVSTPYEAKIKPILDTPIKNFLDGAVELPDGGILERSEMTTWLSLIKMSKGIDIIGKLVDGEKSADKQAKMNFKLRLIDVTDSKLAAIKLIRELIDTPMKNARLLVDNCPITLDVKSDIDTMYSWREKFEGIGVDAKIINLNKI